MSLYTQPYGKDMTDAYMPAFRAMYQAELLVQPAYVAMVRAEIGSALRVELSRTYHTLRKAALRAKKAYAVASLLEHSLRESAWKSKTHDGRLP